MEGCPGRGPVRVVFAGVHGQARPQQAWAGGTAHGYGRVPEWRPRKLVTEVVEIESGKWSDWPKLAEALHLCRLHNATLVIAKLDRLSRDAHLLLGLKKAGVDFVAADMPSTNRLTVGIMAMVADEERRMISKRTKDALAAAKA